LQRASRTCVLAGLGDRAEVDRDLVEWDYGEYEGRTTREIQASRPGWSLFRDGCPGGETLGEIGARADRVVQRVRAEPGNVILFSSGHFLRVLAARWLGLDAASGQRFVLGTTALCALGYEHDRSEPVIRLWNQVALSGR
jgi:probable phosphoglycerate mutase